MSLPSLLRYVGLDIPRGVSIDGRVLTGRAATAAVTTGAATAIVPHTFHGGNDPAVQTAPSAWWDDSAARDSDIAVVRRNFPHFILDRRGGGHTWTGTIDTGRGRFAVAIAADSADGLPAIAPVRPRALGRNEGRHGFRPAPHLYLSGNLCVADTGDWHPGEHTSATAIAWAAHWYAAYTDWRIGGPWPTEGYRSNAAA